MTSQPHCPHCSAALQPAATFCSSCGKPAIPPKQAQSGWSLLSCGALGCLLLVGLGVGFLAVMPKRASRPVQAAAQAAAPTPSTAVISRPTVRSPIGTVSVAGPKTGAVGRRLSFVLTVVNQGDEVVEGFGVAPGRSLKYSFDGCVPECNFVDSQFKGADPILMFAGQIAPGETKRYTVNIIPDQPGMFVVTWLPMDGQQNWLNDTDGRLPHRESEFTVTR